MKRQSVYAMLLIISASFARFAGATDLPPEVYAPETAINSVGSGWYLRGDLGYAGWIKHTPPTYNAVTGTGPTYTQGEFDTSRFSTHMTYGGGAGYQVNDMFRLDATADAFQSDMDGSSKLAIACDGAQSSGTNCGFHHTSSMRGVQFMGNAYADLGTFSGITPYVGAGAGVTYVNWSTMTTQSYCIDGAASCIYSPNTPTQLEGLSSWRFTYALMAGMSYDLSDRIKLDLGYRYSKIDGGAMFGQSQVGKSMGASDPMGSDGGLSRHEVRGGIRVSVW